MSLLVTPRSSWNSTAWLVGVILLMSSCGGDSDNSADDNSLSAPDTTAADTTAPEPTTTTTSTEPTTTTTSEPPTTTAAPTTAAAPTTTTTAAPTTTEPEWHQEAPLLFDLLVADSEWYARDGSDSLRATVRSGPGIDYDEAAMITVPRLVIEGTGAVLTDDRGVGWRELLLGIGRTG